MKDLTELHQKFLKYYSEYGSSRAVPMPVRNYVEELESRLSKREKKLKHIQESIEDLQARANLKADIYAYDLMRTVLSFFDDDKEGR